MSPPEPTDAWLIQQSFADSAWFGLLFARHYDSVHRFVARQVGSTAADDVTQDAFLVAWDHRDRYDSERADARPWLFGIAHNLVLREYRRARRKTQAVGRLRHAVATTSDLSDQIDNRLVAEGLRMQLRDAILSLPPRERESFVLLVLGELTYVGVADLLGIRVGTAKTRVARAKRRLRETMDNTGVEDLF